MEDNPNTPVLRLRPKKSPQRFRRGAPWIFADEVVLDRRTKALKPGTIAEVQDENRVPFALAAVNTGSKIVGRILDLDHTAVIDKSWLISRFRTCLALRERLYDTPFYRLVHGEGDGLPGLIVDRFGNTLAVQPNAAWADVRIDEIAAALQEVTGATAVFKNASGRARSLEGLDETSAFVTGAVSGPVAVEMNGATYMADIEGGQKTGLFFDQRDNHAMAARLAKGERVLDVFSHVGGFALACLAAGAREAVSIDGSAPALELATAGAQASGFADRFAVHKEDAFAAMRQMHDAGETFGVVICDPPAFAPHKGALEAGLRGYERVAMAGTKLVASGGYLVLCSCSHAVDLATFREVSLKGIGRSGRRAQLIHTGQAGPDHPEHPVLAETGYLKSIFLRLD